MRRAARKSGVARGRVSSGTKPWPIRARQNSNRSGEVPAAGVVITVTTVSLPLMCARYGEGCDYWDKTASRGSELWPVRGRARRES